MTYIPPYAEQLAQAESIARAELAGQPTDRDNSGLREEAVWYGVREVFPKGLPEDVLQQAADRVELAIARNS